MEWLTNPEIWVAFFTLTALEIVLGIDNIIMISILSAACRNTCSSAPGSSVLAWP